MYFFASQDWGTDSSSGLISVTIFKGNYSHFDASYALFNGFNCQGFSNEYSITGCPNGSEISVPIPVSLVTQMCKNCEDSSYGCNMDVILRYNFINIKIECF